MSLILHKESPDIGFTSDELKSDLFEALNALSHRKKVVAIPPDYTRFHSFAGELTSICYQYFGQRLTDVLPALGTHSAMTRSQIVHMFKNVPENLFRIHDWRNDVVTLGEVPSDFVNEVSEGKVNYAWPAQVNKLLVEGGHDLILSIGQVVPHEVIGMANYNKNVFVGTGGLEGINKSHFLGAAYGMERIMGRPINPVRQVMNYAADNFAAHLPIIYVLTVVGKNQMGKLVVKGLYVGDDMECFEKASELSLKENFQVVEEPLHKVIVYLDRSEYKSTWLGNKSIYRTRMASADGGELIILAPGLKEFGEDKQIDELIRRYGYLTTPEILKLTEENEDLQNNLSAAAHLIHGSSENRFKVTYCPGCLSQDEIESVNFNYAGFEQMMKKYDPSMLKEGYNKLRNGEEIYYISNPALGLWAHRDRMN